MVQTTMSRAEFTKLVNEAVKTAIDSKSSVDKDELLTDQQAAEYIKCSSVFLWQQRKAGHLKAVRAGKKLLYPKSSLNAFIGLKKEEVK
ncbi:MAG: helix-turn-helix domain-containing protein [Chitinophagaceae bacterium]